MCCCPQTPGGVPPLITVKGTVSSVNSAVVVLIMVRKEFGFFSSHQEWAGASKALLSYWVSLPQASGWSYSLGLFLICACWHLLAADLCSAQARASRSSEDHPGNFFCWFVAHLSRSLASMLTSLF